MKNLIFILLMLTISCDAMLIDKVSNNVKLHSYTLTISGDCDFISIHNAIDTTASGFIYHALPLEYIESDEIYQYYDNVQTLDFRIVKHTNDASVISATLIVNGTMVLNVSETTAYGEIIISHSL